MAIVFHSSIYHEIVLDSNIIIGVTGDNYQAFLKSLTSDDIYYIDNNSINNEQVVLNVLPESLGNEKINKYLKDLGLDQKFLNKKVSLLSHSEQKLLKYLKMLINNPHIVVIDEPFQDLDYEAKKKIIALLNNLVKNKTIIIGSLNTNILYTLCKKVLLLGKNRFLYRDWLILTNKTILKQYHLSMPEIVEFIKLARKKKIKLPYSKDIRDLIKDVYKHVSK